MTSESPRQVGAELRRQMLGDDAPDEGEGGPFGFTDGPFGFVDDFIEARIFGELWQREGLDLRTRSLCTIAVILAARMPDAALRVHIVGALANGATQDEISEVIVQTAFYAGFPVLAAGIPVAREVFDR
jgi:4-carboxymuconolactone decarboxylase